MSNGAQAIFTLIERGTPLRIPHDPAIAPSVVESPHWPVGLQEQIVDRSAVQELLGSGLLHKLSENGEGARVGWKYIGLDGSIADFWVCVQ